MDDKNKLDLKEQVNILKMAFKVIILLVIIIAISPLVNSLGKASLYNLIFNGRLRLPFGENSSLSYNLTLNNLDAMFASHIINGQEKRDDEYRIIVIGDSSTWGILLHPDQTLPALIDKGLSLCQGKSVKVFNLGYPTLSLTKDVLIMAFAMEYEPDLVIWPLTLESFPLDKQTSNPLIENNMDRIRSLNKKFGLITDLGEPPTNLERYLKNNLISKRKEYADLIRLQFLGAMWSATGIDQVYPGEYSKAKNDLDDSMEFHGFNSANDLENNLAFYAIDNMKKIIGSTPIIIINEPILVSDGLNHEIRYNFYYPIWAYDLYRTNLKTYLDERGWNFLDLWDIVPRNEFTNSAIHLSPTGETIYSNEVINYIQESICYEK